MAAEAYAVPAPLVGNPIPTVWKGPVRKSVFGDIAVVLFLLSQCFDGVLTYVGVASFGLGIEANPLLTALMTTFGHGAGLAGAKIVAGTLGICLHLREVHGAVAVLTGFYFAVAIAPWAAILFW
jgi:hypothetical protein